MKWPVYEEIPSMRLSLIEAVENGKPDGHHVCSIPIAVIEHDGRVFAVNERENVGGHVGPFVEVLETSRAAYDEILRIHG